MMTEAEAKTIFKKEVPETKIHRICRWKNGFAAVCIANGFNELSDFSNPYFYLDEKTKKVSRIDVINNLDVFEAFKKEE